MKKNFFKKLSFVLALAMIVSTIMPSAGAFAATKAPKLNSAKQYLYLDAQDGKQEYDFNISNKLTGWKYAWSSSNEDVAEVASNGVATAVGIGTAKVSVVITKKGAEVATLSATVVVKDNIRTLTITNTPAGDKLAVGQENDFNRSFVTSSNSTTKTTGITRWSVNSDKATISDSGLFKATEAGDFVITARSFQSTAKYDAWKVSKDATLVTATKDYTVKVVPSMVEAKQVDLDTFKVTFDSATKDAASKLTVFTLVGTTEVSQVIKKVTMDADNKGATVDMYVPFTEGATFVVKYPDMASVQFTAAVVKPENVTSVEVLTKTVELGTPKTLEIALYNKDGVNIANSTLLSRVDLESSLVSTYLDKPNKALTMFKVGDSTTITATYHTYNYDIATGTEVGTITASTVINCLDKSADQVGLMSAYTVVSNNNPNYESWAAKHSVAVGDAGLKLFAQLKGKKVDGSELVTSSKDNAAFTFQSTDESILIVDPTSGAVYPVKVGSAVVIVKYNKEVVGSAAVTVTGRREIGSVTLDTNSVTLSNDTDVHDAKNISIKVKDQLGEDYSNANYDVYVTKTSNNAGTVLNWNNDDGFGFDGANGIYSNNEDDALAAGVYTYEVKVEDVNTHKVLKTFATVTLQKPSSDESIYFYRLESDKTSYDMKLETWDHKEDVTLQLFGYAQNGVRNHRYDITAGEFNVTVTNPKNADVTGSLVAGPQWHTEDAILNLVTVSNGSIQKAEKGTYTVNVVSGSGVNARTINTAYFTVNDTQAAPVVTVNKLYTDKTTALDAIKDCFKITVNGNDVTSTVTATNASYYGSTTDANGVVTVFIKEVYFSVDYSDTTLGNSWDAGVDGNLNYTVPVNITIHYNYR